MTGWLWILAACAVAYATKLAGYLAPGSWLDAPVLRRSTTALTVGLLTSLIVVNTVGSGQSLTLDARVAALVAAAVALTLRVPFLGVVVVGALAAALARLAGLA